MVPSQLWGRAQGVRTALRNFLEALGPLFSASRGSSPRLRPTRVAGAEVLPGQTHGLLITFLLTLIPLAGAGVLLLVTRGATW